MHLFSFSHAGGGGGGEKKKVMREGGAENSHIYLFRPALAHLCFVRSFHFFSSHFGGETHEERDAHHLPRKRDGEEKQAKKGGITPSTLSLFYFYFSPPLPHFLCFSRPNTNCSLYVPYNGGCFEDETRKWGWKNQSVPRPPPKKTPKKCFTHSTSIFTPAKLVLP